MNNNLYLSFLTLMSVILFIFVGGDFLLLVYYSSLYFIYLRFSNLKYLALMLGGIAMGPLLYYKVVGGREQTLSGAWLNEQTIPIALSFVALQFCLFVAREQRSGQIFRYSRIQILFAVNFIPQLIAGPILPVRDFLEKNASLVAGFRHRFFYPMAFFGFALFMKIFLAEWLLILIDLGSSNLDRLTNIEAVFLLISFYFFIYFDFLSYSLIAVSISSLLGFRMLWNFMAPYRACSLPEFWRRWHISLYVCFKEAIYQPLTQVVPSVFAVFVVFMISGLWHGIGFGFILWGLWHAFGVCVCRIYARLGRRRLNRWLGWVLTQLFVLIGWAFFWLNDVEDLMLFFEKIASPDIVLPVSIAFHFPFVDNLGFVFAASSIGLGLNLVFFLCVCIFFLYFFDRTLLRYIGEPLAAANDARDYADVWGFPKEIPSSIVSLGIALGLFSVITAGQGITRYVYFNF